MRNLFIIGTFVLLSYSGFAQQEPNSGTHTLEELNSKIRAIFESSALPGFAVVVVNDKEVMYQQAMGFADLETKKKYTAHTTQNIASISKTFIAVALMKAIDQGAVDLDTDINTYLPFKVVHPLFQKTPITLRHLANHTSGIDDERTYDKCYLLDEPNADYSHLPKRVRKYISLLQQNEKLDNAEFLEKTLRVNGEWFSKKNFTKEAPGKAYRYSNIGAALAAFVIESAVGMPYEAYTKKYIFEPLQMNESTWELSEEGADKFASKYFKKGLRVPDYSLITKADGGLITNTTDFAKYLIEMLKGLYQKGTLLSKSSYKEMFERKEFGEIGSGIFWEMTERGTPYHSGSDPGVMTYTSINQNKNIAAFFMTNIGAELIDEDDISIGKIHEVLKQHNWE
ncbi:serine hydrolase [Maribacter algarum]|nr:serine hydrolase domain-containing protein [Maribacter algarum]